MKEVESNFRELLQNSPELARQVMQMSVMSKAARFQCTALKMPSYEHNIVDF